MARAKVKQTFRDRVETAMKTVKSPTFHLEFSNIDKWISAGNYAMNRFWSGRFDRSLLFGRNYILYGESGSGKSLMAAWFAAAAQKEHNALVVWIDVEKATDDEAGKAWLVRAGVDVNNMIYATAATLEEIKTVISEIASTYRESVNAEGDDKVELQPILFVVDSWSAAMTKSQWEYAEKGKIVGDQGQKAKQTGDVILSATHLVGGIPVMIIGTMHIMDNQDGHGRRHKITGGNKALYMASGALLLTKSELKDLDADDKEIVEAYKELRKGFTEELRKKFTYGKVIGITCKMEILKSRVSKPFEQIEIQIPYVGGLDKYAGLFDLLMQEGLFKKGESSWYNYTYPGEKDPTKFQKANFVSGGHADRLMAMSDMDIGDDKKDAPIPDIVADNNGLLFAAINEGKTE